MQRRAKEKQDDFYITFRDLRWSSFLEVINDESPDSIHNYIMYRRAKELGVLDWPLDTYMLFSNPVGQQEYDRLFKKFQADKAHYLATGELPEDE